MTSYPFFFFLLEFSSCVLLKGLCLSRSFAFFKGACTGRALSLLGSDVRVRDAQFTLVVPVDPVFHTNLLVFRRAVLLLSAPSRSPTSAMGWL